MLADNIFLNEKELNSKHLILNYNYNLFKNALEMDR